MLSRSFPLLFMDCDSKVEIVNPTAKLYETEIILQYSERFGAIVSRILLLLRFILQIMHDGLHCLLIAFFMNL